MAVSPASSWDDDGDASVTRPPGDATENHHGGNKPPTNGTPSATWQKAIELIRNVKEGLEKEVGVKPCFTQALNEALVGLTKATPGESPALHKINTRLARIETILEKPSTRTNEPTTAKPNNTTWAAVAAAAGLRQAGAPPTPNPQRHTVRIQMEKAKSMANPEIL